MRGGDRAQGSDPDGQLARVPKDWANALIATAARLEEPSGADTSRRVDKVKYLKCGVDRVTRQLQSSPSTSSRWYRPVCLPRLQANPPAPDEQRQPPYTIEYMPDRLEEFVPCRIPPPLP